MSRKPTQRVGHPGDLLSDENLEKDLYIEFDFSSEWADYAGFIATRIQDILQTAGISAHVLLDENSVTANAVMKYQDAKSLLARTRQHRDMLHIVLVNSSPDEELCRPTEPTLGIAVCYGPGIPFDNFGRYCCRRLVGSSERITAQAYLDSVGCVVFAAQVYNYLTQTVGGNWQFRWESWDGVFALLLAHEIGHALGRTSHDSLGGIMDCPSFDDSQDDYSNHCYSLKGTLNKWGGVMFPNQKDAVNTRDVLGITTIDIGS